MYTTKLNPFQQKPSFMPIPFNSYGSWKVEKAAILIQSTFRQYCARKRYMSIAYRNYIKKVSLPAIAIQSSWRRYKAIRTAKLLAFSKAISNYCNEQAGKIARYYKGI